MRFEWDEVKNVSNKAKHGIDFERVKELFFKADSLFLNAKNIEGEQRKAVIGRLDMRGAIYICIYVEKKWNYRIISARIASENERKLWQKK